MIFRVQRLVSNKPLVLLGMSALLVYQGEWECTYYSSGSNAKTACRLADLLTYYDLSVK